MATESFFSNASLAYLASAGAGKDGKAYSIKPTDGTGDFTFSRGSNLAATRVGADGLIEKGRENLLLQSNQFDTSPWANNTAGDCLVTSGFAGYDGTNNAWEAKNDGRSYFRQYVTYPSQVKTFSIYVKSGNQDYFSLYIVKDGGDPDVSCDLGLGTITNNDSDNIDATITPVTGATGWYRVSLTWLSASTGSDQIRIVTGGTLADTIFVQNAQLEIGLAATDYIESGATTGKAGLLEDEPRFDYSGGATCPSLLLEPSRTNLVGYSEYFDGSYWPKADVTIENNATTSPQGKLNASKFVASATNANHLLNKTGFLSITSGDTYTFSIFAKAAEYDFIRLQFQTGPFPVNYANFDLTNGTKGLNTGATDTKIESLGNGWYKCVLVVTATSTGNSGLQPFVLDSDRSGTSPSYLGDGTSGIYIYGAQLEQGSYPTSYIPNHSGGSVTRGAEDVSALDVSSILGTDSYTIFLDVETQNIGSNINAAGDIFYLSVGSQTLAIDTRVSVIQDDSSSTTRIKVDVGDNITRYKGALRVTPTTATIFGNGIEGQSGTSRALSPTSFSFYYNNKLNYNKVLFFPTALSDADCITLTTL